MPYIETVEIFIVRKKAPPPGNDFGALIGAKVAKGYGTTDGHTCVKLPIPSLDSCCCTGTYDIVYWSILLCRLTVYCTNYTVL